MPFALAFDFPSLSDGIIVLAIILLLSGPVVAVNTARQRTRSLPPPSSEVISQVAAGQRILAIKTYRQATGATLAEAKRVIDSAATAQRLQHPQ